jgi:tRNA threonylcarbamoyladenosine biosynthesis protein TsaB
MIVLGLDTSTTATAAALRLTGGVSLERRDDPPARAHPGHATRLLAMVDELLGEAGIALRDVALIAVGSGPGTFTGLRVGIATARGLAQSLGVELAPVSSLRALARGADGGAAAGRPVLAAIDARRGEVFGAAYAAGGGEELAAPRALAPERVPALLDAAGLSGEAPVAIGDGALRYRDAFASAGADVPGESSPLHLLRAAAVCELGLAVPAVTYGEVLPDYLRRPDAELALHAAGGGAAR